MNNDGVYTQEEFKKLEAEAVRRYNFLDRKEFEYRGHYGHATLMRDNDTGEEKWCGKEASTWHRFYGNTLEEVEEDFRWLVDGLIDELGEPGEPKND